MMDSTYSAVYARSLEDPEGFWAEAARDIDWTRQWDTVLDRDAQPVARWFVGGELNTCYNALDRHYDSAVTGTVETFTYSELRDRVARFAGVLASQGVGRGDRVVIYMPMIPQAAIAMLACARLGAVHSVVFGGFASKELAVRIDDCTPKVVVSASCGIEVNCVIEYKPLLDKAIEIAEHQPDHTIIYQRDQATASRRWFRDGTSTGQTRCATHNHIRVSPLLRPTRCTSSTRPGPRASPKASSGTTGVTPLPSSGQ